MSAASDPGNAFRWYQRGAQMDQVQCICNLGVAYMDGCGTPVDVAKAIDCYKRAAEMGDAIAQFNLGVCYQEGSGVEQDIVEAHELFRLAAMSGHRRANRKLTPAFIRKALLAEAADG